MIIKEIQDWKMDENGEMEKVGAPAYYKQMPDKSWKPVDLTKLAKIAAAKQIIKIFCKELEAEMIAQIDEVIGGKENA